MPEAGFPFPFPLAQDVITAKRGEILRILTKDPDFRSVPIRAISHGILSALPDAYDSRFFGGYLSRRLGFLSVTLSSRLTSSAGNFCCTKGPFGLIKTAEIRMSSDFFLRLEYGPFELNGLTVSSPQEAFLLVFEHELCHAIETILFLKTGHSSRFLSLANGLFGHTATKHRLPTRRREAADCGLIVGMKAEFSYRNEMLRGVITYIGKTATVMVPSPSGEYRDSSGRRYTKYRVPVSLLKPV